ncbi:MAG: PEP/pyruvate-binding domain-containing protein [Polyangiales bacterium]
MDSNRPVLIPLDAVEACHEPVVGGKAAKLSQLARAGFAVPRAVCLTTWAYESFVGDSDIVSTIRMELGRKSLDEMRWEEIWDAALRIRAAFMLQPLSDSLQSAIAESLGAFDSSTPLAVRSSAIGEDSADRSFAGLHESIIGVRGTDAVRDAVRLVWASLWSDAALLYRKELGLDPACSRMAVLIQEMVDDDRSGVAFARDPRDLRTEHAIIESVPGPCSLLVDGVIDPDRWEIHRKTRSVIEWRPGQREEPNDDGPLLEPRDLEKILDTLLSVEQLFSWAPDMEWTGCSERLTVLQARPITTVAPEEDDTRNWYLSLRPSDVRLRDLRRRVSEELIPQLEALGQRLAAERLDLLDDEQLAQAIRARADHVAEWKKTYWDEFIPFAHGVRRLGTYYNDAVKPDDPYEFVGLLRDQPLLAAQRNRAIAALAQDLASHDSVRAAVEQLLGEHAGSMKWADFRRGLMEIEAGAAGFVEGFERLSERFLDVTYDDERLYDQPELLLRNIVELSRLPDRLPQGSRASGASASLLQQRLLDAVGPERHEEARNMMETGRVSWKLRDDDNLLVARLQSQLLRALSVAASRLRDRGQLVDEDKPNASHVKPLVQALRTPNTAPIVLTPRTAVTKSNPLPTAQGESSRQLIGQPASPGLAAGTVRCIRGRDSLSKFRCGDILVCDAIEPTMTHLVPLASAIVERRGGMLIHGSIIARELGIPCVNGVRNAADVLKDGDFVTVDGHLGIVTVGAAEFDLERDF